MNNEILGKLGPKTKFDPLDSNIEKFNYRTNWETRIRPLLHDPDVEHALAKSMNEYRTMRARACNGHSDWETPYCIICGPLQNETSDYWAVRSIELLDQAIERGEVQLQWPADPKDEEAMAKANEKYDQLLGEFYPKRDSLEWYTPENGRRHLVHWQWELGKKVYPDLHWKLKLGDLHAFAYGTDKDGNVKVIFDIFSFEDGRTPAELFEEASRRLDLP